MFIEVTASRTLTLLGTTLPVRSSPFSKLVECDISYGWHPEGHILMIHALTSPDYARQSDPRPLFYNTWAAGFSGADSSGPALKRPENRLWAPYKLDCGLYLNVTALPTI
jgi:hypothetical protein